MLNLQRSISPPAIASSSFHSNKQQKSVSFCRIRIWESDELKKSGRIGGFNFVNAAEKDSEFEVDPDKAREALRKLDEQIQSLSKKQVDPPKIRVIKPSVDGPEPVLETRTTNEAEEPELSGFLGVF